jgi:hypothetical protein
MTLSDIWQSSPVPTERNVKCTEDDSRLYDSRIYDNLGYMTVFLGPDHALRLSDIWQIDFLGQNAKKICIFSM